MLRITEHRNRDGVVLKLEGAFSNETVSELEASWQAARMVHAAESLWVDLSDVYRVEPAGWTLLRRMRRSGVRFLTRGCLMGELVKEILESEPCVTGNT
jgi:ABC-type transporter Mla MlaB component